MIANREENFRRPLYDPYWSDDYSIAGLDYGTQGQHTMAGSWLGYNKHGLVVALTNRDDGDHENVNRSVGLLLTDILKKSKTVEEAIVQCRMRLGAARHRPVNFIIADLEVVYVISNANGEIQDHKFCLEPGTSRGLTHTISNLDIDDPNDPRVTFASYHMDRCVEEDLFDKATEAFSSDVIVRDIPAHQTRCSSVITIDIETTTMHHSRGVPFGRQSYKRVEERETVNNERRNKSSN